MTTPRASISVALRRQDQHRQQTQYRGLAVSSLAMRPMLPRARSQTALRDQRFRLRDQDQAVLHGNPEEPNQSDE
jgi:hypothetical protein